MIHKALLDPNLDLEAYIEEQLIARILASPEFRREELRFLYGTRAMKQLPSWHKETRRVKRRKRK